jgi:hypothetical protein
MLAEPATPGGAGRTGQDRVEQVACEVPDLAAVPGCQRNAVQGVGAVPSDVGEAVCGAKKVDSVAAQGGACCKAQTGSRERDPDAAGPA